MYERLLQIVERFLIWLESTPKADIRDPDRSYAELVAMHGPM